MNIRKLNELFENSKLSKVEFAKRCGVTRATLDNALQGGDIRVSILERIASTLKIPVGFLFDETTQQTHVSTQGDFSPASVHGDATVGATADVAVLQERINSMQKLLAEKERLIMVYEKMMEGKK